MKQSDIDRCLVMVYESSNHAMYVNYSLQYQRVKELCKNPDSAIELVQVLRGLADKIEEGVLMPKILRLDTCSRCGWCDEEDGWIMPVCYHPETWAENGNQPKVLYGYPEIPEWCALPNAPEVTPEVEIYPPEGK